MVMILTSEDDESSNDVIDWLRFYKTSFLRISEKNTIVYNKIVLNNNEFDIEFSINNVNYNLSDFNAFWYRRSHYNFLVNKILVENLLTQKINNHIENETKEIHDFFISYVEKYSINKYKDNFTNKLNNLKKASNLGIKIPNTIITNCKKDILNFLETNKMVITKNFSQGVFISDQNEFFSSSTKIVTHTIANNLSDNFSYSLFQEGIDKLF